MLVGIGYTNFSSNTGVISNNTVQVSSTNNIGDVQLVSSSSAIVDNDENVVNKVNNGVVDNKNTNEINNNVINNETQVGLVDNKNENISENTVETSSTENKKDYFSELKMERNDMYSKSIETYQNIISSDTISSEQKSIAIQEIDKINSLQNSISVAEELIKLKGFEDVVIYSSNGKISVIVRTAVLSETRGCTNSKYSFKRIFS